MADNYIADPKGQLLGQPVPPPFGSVIPVQLLTGLNVVHVITATYNIPISEVFCTYSNEGSTGTVQLTLPLAQAGLTYTLIVVTAQTFRLTAQTGQTIRIAGSVSTSGGNAFASTIGNTLTVVAINSTQWIAESSVGAWGLA